MNLKLPSRNPLLVTNWYYLISQVIWIGMLNIFELTNTREITKFPMNHPVIGYLLLYHLSLWIYKRCIKFAMCHFR